MKSKFYIKVLLIILLAVSLITIPNISNATERTANDEGTLTSAIASATDGDVINLSQDITITAPIEVSGKSITMVYITKKIMEDKDIKNPQVVIATDRIDLDKQIHKTFNRIGVPAKRA